MNYLEPEPANNRPGLSREPVRALALDAGFSDAGLVSLPHAHEERDARRFEEWIRAGRAGSMRYLERKAESGELARSRVHAPFPWARSAVVCFARYDSNEPRSTVPAPRGAGWIARYAWSSHRDEKGVRRPSDYHKVLLKRLKALETRLHAEVGEFESRAYVDTGPVVERSLAVAAGLGWSAKNTCLIHPELGSFGFLAIVLTSLPVEQERTPEQSGEWLTQHPGFPPLLQKEGARMGHPTSGYGNNRVALAVVQDRCGSCRRCIEACPTNALATPYQMDATRCISYLTIEHKGPIAEELMEGMGRQVFGCDICQDVCPWNDRALRRAPIAVDPELEPRAELVNPALEALAAMSEAEFETRFNGSPVRRAGFNGLRRNIAIAIGNSGIAEFAARLETWAEDADEGLRAAANWAMQKLRS